MGRGRAKAKQTKVARELKYGGPQTDLSALEAELSGRKPTPPPADEVEESDDDPYSAYYSEDADEDERS